jgi:hypothetical protein
VRKRTAVGSGGRERERVEGNEKASVGTSERAEGQFWKAEKIRSVPEIVLRILKRLI